MREINELVDAYLLKLNLADATVLVGSSHICSIMIDVCVCVFFPFILDAKFVGCTSRDHTGGRLHMISHLPSFCGACLYFFSSKMKSNFVY